MSSNTSASAFLFLANDPALDFLNTTPMVDGALVDRITDYDALLDFLIEAKLVSAEDAAFARKAWPSGGTAVTRARALRDVLRKVIVQMTDGRRLSVALLSKLNAELRDHSGEYVELLAKEEGFERRHRLQRGSPEDAVAPLARVIASLLVDANLSLVRKCEDPACVLYFLDTSKNHRRRWCSMDLCGNRHKVGAYRARGGR
ncbi:hypothetical protein AKJ09_04473 [Labilithrix luteola]|uniref:Zinc finger CGNR domain-containing protein n=1 Tax=Labilithrix luteola TaxID=1391654 RepID=A0A0K1PXF0_9BACT|nr:CGNR zinc finger domain-containing protein [Labilithrix luteola]AKU97809.1 hypothetical protein AKJ09_04473 [Labilithrix luteola]